MNIEELREIALSLPGVTEDIKWEDHVCFNVGEKMFLVTSPDHVPCTASFKVAEEDFAAICMREGYSPQAYMARHHWVHLDDIQRWTKKEASDHIRSSHTLVASKLSNKLKKSLGI